MTAICTPFQISVARRLVVTNSFATLNAAKTGSIHANQLDNAMYVMMDGVELKSPKVSENVDRVKKIRAVKMPDINKFTSSKINEKSR